MTHIDDFVLGQATRQLVAGEQMVGIGLLRRPYRFNPLGIPTHYEEWLAAATNLRLILLRTEGGTFDVMTVTPKATCLESKEWWYQELRGVTLGSVGGVGGGVTVGLVPHEPLGPYNGEAKRYDIFPKVNDLDGHPQFYAGFREWLQGQVAAGAFPMDAQRQARVAAHQEQQRLEAERTQQLAEERKRKAQAAFGAFAPFIPAVVVSVIGLVILVVGAVLLIDAVEEIWNASESVDRAERQSTLRESDLKWRRAGQDPPSDCPDKSLTWKKVHDCHGCLVYDKEPDKIPPATEWKRVQRGSEIWYCPSVARYEENATSAKKRLKEAEEARGDALGSVIVGAVAVLLGLVGLLGAVVLLVLGLRKRKRAATQAAAA